MSKYAPHRSSSSNPRATSSTTCQKCLGKGHFIYECKYERPYLSRPSRTQQLEKPKLLAKLKLEGKPSVEVPEEFKRKAGTADKILEAREKERAKERDKDGETRKRRRSSSTSESLSNNDNDSNTGSDSDSSTDSRSGSDSDSDSDSDADSRSSAASDPGRGRRSKKSRRRSRSSSR